MHAGQPCINLMLGRPGCSVSMQKGAPMHAGRLKQVRRLPGGKKRKFWGTYDTATAEDCDLGDNTGPSAPSMNAPALLDLRCDLKDVRLISLCAAHAAPTHRLLKASGAPAMHNTKAS